HVDLPADAPSDLFDAGAQAFLADLHTAFEGERQARLAARARRQRAFDAGDVPGFRTDTRSIRESAWRVAPLPAALRDRRVEITGPVDPKMV
ncbi:malate synthase A, partial [Klebsiella pneumoniae]|nr:malate synthase A [Klebsiella pneumoniae]